MEKLSRLKFYDFCERCDTVLARLLEDNYSLTYFAATRPEEKKLWTAMAELTDRNKYFKRNARFISVKPVIQ